MGRLLGFLFFIVLLVVFVIIKALLVGGKAAYDAVFNENFNSGVGGAFNPNAQKDILLECKNIVSQYVMKTGTTELTTIDLSILRQRVAAVFAKYGYFPNQEAIKNLVIHMFNENKLNERKEE